MTTQMPSSRALADRLPPTAKRTVLALATRALSSLALVALVAPLGACTFGKPPPVALTAENFQADPTKPTVPFVEWLGLALSDVKLTEAQRRHVQQRARALMVRHAPEIEARARFAEALARELEEGTVRPEGFGDAQKALAAATEDASKDDADALVDLHGVLDEAQRAALVHALEKRLDAQADDLWNVRTRYMLWRHELNITDEQQGRIFMRLGLDEASLREMREDSRRHRAFLGEVLTAFKGPTFDVSVLEKGESAGALSERRSKRITEYLGAAAPILTEEQRRRAANLLRTRTGKPAAEEPAEGP